MSSRDSIKHTISITAPTAASIGDEWVNPTTPNLLYKRTLLSGSVGWSPMPLSFIGPATNGTTGQVLISQGTKAPIWADYSGSSTSATSTISKTFMMMGA